MSDRVCEVECVHMEPKGSRVWDTLAKATAPGDVWASLQPTHNLFLCFFFPKQRQARDGGENGVREKKDS